MMIDRDFGVAGDRVVIEECLFGQEVSAFVLTDGRSLKMLPFARDFKRVYDNDEGPNTGSMGCYSPVAMVDPALAEEIEHTIMRPTLDALARRGAPYLGFLYAGLMITDGGPRVVEFNCRLGDPGGSRPSFPSSTATSRKSRCSPPTAGWRKLNCESPAGRLAAS